ncbi:hypothetical protein, partial [uncultured Croceicoccus sp.]|uniref:hypothetical protein n=1 Tax=uncultured Croceicoccus sp. TaxID=1295329 RepID=UPI0026239501
KPSITMKNLNHAAPQITSRFMSLPPSRMQRLSLTEQAKKIRDLEAIRARAVRHANCLSPAKVPSTV